MSEAALDLQFTTSGAEAAKQNLDAVADKSVKAEAAADKLAAGNKRAGSAVAQMVASIEKQLGVLVELQRAQGGAANATEQLADAATHAAREQEALVRTSAKLNAAHGSAVGSTKALQQATLGMSRQFTDIGVQLAGGQNPFLVLTQQLPQIADTFAVASMQGLGFKAVIRGMVAEAMGLIAAFAPWIAGLAAVGAGIWYLVDAHNKQKKAVSDLNAALVKQREELSKISPFLFTTGQNADLAADGQKNFDAWLQKTNISLAEQNRLLRENTLNANEKKWGEAADNLFKAQQQLAKASRPGPTIMAGGMGGFSAVQAPTATDPKNNPFYKEAASNLQKAKEDYAAIDAYRKKMLEAPATAFGLQTASTKATVAHTKAIEEQVKQIGLLTATVEADGETWSERAAIAHYAALKERDLAAAQQDLNKILATDRPATALESMAAGLERAADEAYAVTRNIEDIAYAINKNDWTSALAGLVRVLANVQNAFRTATTAKEKYAAVAQLAQGVGAAVGGKGGAVVGGAGSGALAGLGVASSLTTLGLAVPGPGWALAAGGAVLGALGGLFGSSSAKKKQKAEEEAARLAAEQARVQEIANQKRSLELQLMEAQGWSFVALTAQRADELAKMDASNRALAESVYAAQDAAKTRDLNNQLLEAQGRAEEALADRRIQQLATLSESDQAIQKQIWAEELLTEKRNAAADLAAKVADRQASIQDRIDELTLSPNDLLLKQRARERAEVVALDLKLGDLIDKFYGLQDAATKASEATAAAAAEQESASKAFNDELNRQLKVDEQYRARAVAQQDTLNATMAAFADAAYNAAHALDGAMKGLTDFADSLKTELGLSVSGGGMDQAKRAFNAAVATKNYSAIPELGKAYADAAKGELGGTAYLQVLAQIRQASLNSATSAKSDSYQSSLSVEAVLALLSGRDIFESTLAKKAAGLPHFANGGSFTIGGISGVDQNTMSINGQDVARVGKGEIVSVQPAGANDNSYAELVAEVRALRQQIANIEGSAAKTAKHTESLDGNIDNVTEGGTNMLTLATQ